MEVKEPSAKYLARPRYKQTEVGVIPADWEIQSGEQITNLIGKGGSPRWQGFDYSNSGMLFVTSENVRNGYLDIREPKYLPLAFHEKLKRTKLQKHDVLINLVGASIGRSCRVPYELGEANVNQAVAVFRVKEPVSSAFIACYFQAPTTVDRILDMQVDAARPNISLGDLRRFLIPLPTKAEQEAIAEALSDADALIESLEQLLAKKRNLKQGAMQHLLTGKKRLPGFSGDWEVERLGDVTELIPGGVYGEEKPRDALVPCRIATTAHIDEDDTWNGKEMNVRYFSREQVEHYSPIEGDLVVVKSSGSAAKIQSGKIGFVDREIVGQFLFSNFLMLLRPIVVVPRFLYFYLCSRNVKKLLPTLVEASTYPNIRIPEYLGLEIPIPPLPEQTAIAGLLSDMDAEIAALEAKLAKARQLKQGMMQELLTGRIRLI